MADRQHRHFLPAAGCDLFLPFYDPYLRLLGADRARNDLIDQANIKPNYRILDIGCGTGILVVRLKKQFQSVQVVGLDPDPKALRRARNKARRAAVSVQLDQGFADELPYRAGAFDQVFSSFMFLRLEENDREKMLREVLRVLKPGGSFNLLDFVGINHGTSKHLGRLTHFIDRLKENSADRILQQMRQAGFAHAEKVKDASLLFGLLRTAYYTATSNP